MRPSCLLRKSASVGVCIAERKTMGCSNRNNDGCGCGNDVTMQQGNAFTLLFEYKPDGEAAVLPSGYDLIVGMYGMNGSLLKSAKLSAGTITAGTDGTYRMHVSHSESISMIGAVITEVTIKNADGTIVNHAANTVTINFVPRRNNSLIETQSDQND